MKTLVQDTLWYLAAMVLAAAILLLASVFVSWISAAQARPQPTIPAVTLVGAPAQPGYERSWHHLRAVRPGADCSVAVRWKPNGDVEHVTISSCYAEQEP